MENIAKPAEIICVKKSILKTKFEDMDLATLINLILTPEFEDYIKANPKIKKM